MKPANWLLIALATLALTAAPLKAAEPVRNAVDHYLAAIAGGGGAADILLRLDLDVVGGPDPEVFLTDGGAWSKSGSLWRLYSPTASGFDFLGTARFHEDAFFIDASSGELVALQPLRINSYMMVRYAITADTIREVESRQLVDTVTGEPVEETARLRATIEAFRESQAFAVARAPLAEVLRDSAEGPPLWIDIETRKPVGGLRSLTGAAVRSLAAIPEEDRTLFWHLTTERTFQPNNRIYFLALDLTGDGRDELLFSTHLRHPTLGWLVYSPSARGLRYLGALAFDPARIRLSDEEDGTLLVFRDEPKVVAAYRIDEGGIRQVAATDWSMNFSRLGSPELQRMREWRRASGLRVLFAPFRELAESPQAAVWHEVPETSRELDDGDRRPADIDFSTLVETAGEER